MHAAFACNAKILVRLALGNAPARRELDGCPVPSCPVYVLFNYMSIHFAEH